MKTILDIRPENHKLIKARIIQFVVPRVIVWGPAIATMLAIFTWSFNGGPSWLLAPYIWFGWRLRCHGIGIGYHRYATHAGFEPKGKLGEAAIAFWLAMGSLALQGPVLIWVGIHKKHHANSDKPGDPHSPHLHDDEGFVASLKGFLHAHILWMVRVNYANFTRATPKLNKNWVIRNIHKYYFWIVLAGFCLGYALFGWHGVLGTAISVFLAHHTTWAVNSICHLWGTRNFATADKSRNNRIIASATGGESNHNNHHAFPKSACHGLKGEPDRNWKMICLMHRLNLITEPYVPSKEKQEEEAQRLIQQEQEFLKKTSDHAAIAA